MRAGETLGSPVSLLIRNKDWENWQQTMHAEAEPPVGATGALRPVVTRPRPGHADLAGAIKYDRTDIRDVLERASARETAARVAAGAIARQLLGRFDVEIVSHVYRVNGIGLDSPLRVTFEAARDIGSDSALRCADLDAEVNMIAEIDRCREAGDTAGGAFEVIARGLPVGLGSYVHWDRKLDGRLAQAMMSIPAIKGVGIGIGPKAASVPGSRDARRDRSGAQPHEAADRRLPSHEQRRRSRRRRHQRRRSEGLGLHEADRHADEAAALGRSRAA